MKKAHLVSFINAIGNVVFSVINEKPELGKPYQITDNHVIADEVAVMIGVTGEIVGQMIVTLSTDAAKKLASRMLEEELPDFNADGKSAISELSNMISANATIELANIGVSSDITTPTFIMAKGMKVTCPPNSTVIAIPFKLSTGEVVMSLALRG